MLATESPQSHKETAMLRHLSLFLLILAVFGCSIPKIIVLGDPLTPEEHLNLGIAYEQKGEYDLAIREYESASKRITVAYFYLGNAYFLKSEHDKAEAFYRKAIRKDPGLADAYNNLAWLLYSRKKNRDEARSLVLKAIALNPEGTATYLDTLKKIENCTADNIE
jgi:tetratricopeptide (TPR) repeat protein